MRTSIWRVANLWIAEGFGLGRVPYAAGTVGSLAGLVWFALLLAPGNVWFYLGGLVAGFLVSVRVCGDAEKTLGKTDPPSVVLDEIVAVPLCFAVWVARWYFRHGELPSPSTLSAPSAWLPVAFGLALFRLFDVVKPWPVRQSQSLAGGWGITIDDTLAAVYVNAATAVVLALSLGFGHPVD